MLPYGLPTAPASLTPVHGTPCRSATVARGTIRSRAAQRRTRVPRRGWTRGVAEAVEGVKLVIHTCHPCNWELNKTQVLKKCKKNSYRSPFRSIHHLAASVETTKPVLHIP